MTGCRLQLERSPPNTFKCLIFNVTTTAKVQIMADNIRNSYNVSLARDKQKNTGVSLHVNVFDCHLIRIDYFNS